MRTHDKLHRVTLHFALQTTANNAQPVQAILNCFSTVLMTSTISIGLQCLFGTAHLIVPAALAEFTHTFLILVEWNLLPYTLEVFMCHSLANQKL